MKWNCPWKTVTNEHYATYATQCITYCISIRNRSYIIYKQSCSCAFIDIKLLHRSFTCANTVSHAHDHVKSNAAIKCLSGTNEFFYFHDNLLLGITRGNFVEVDIWFGILLTAQKKYEFDDQTAKNMRSNGLSWSFLLLGLLKKSYKTS